MMIIIYNMYSIITQSHRFFHRTQFHNIHSYCWCNPRSCLGWCSWHTTHTDIQHRNTHLIEQLLVDCTCSLPGWRLELAFHAAARRTLDLHCHRPTNSWCLLRSWRRSFVRQKTTASDVKLDPICNQWTRSTSLAVTEDSSFWTATEFKGQAIPRENSEYLQPTASPFAVL